MDIDIHLNLIPQSQSDQLLREWGYDLVREYFTIAQLLPPAKSPVLELATGSGRMCAVLSCIFPTIISGDVSFLDLPRAKQRIPKQFAERVHFLQLDMKKLPFRSEQIPSLVCMNTLHEVEDPHECLREMVRVVHHNGSLAVGEFNRNGFDAMRKIHEIVYHNVHHEGTISHDEIKMELTASFHSVHVFETQLNISYFATDKK